MSFKISDIRNYTGEILIFRDPVSGEFVRIQPESSPENSVEIIHLGKKILGLPIQVRKPYFKNPQAVAGFSSVIVTSSQFIPMFRTWPNVFYCTARNFSIDPETGIRWVSSLTAASETVSNRFL